MITLALEAETAITQLLSSMLYNLKQRSLPQDVKSKE